MIGFLIITILLIKYVLLIVILHKQDVEMKRLEDDNRWLSNQVIKLTGDVKLVELKQEMK